MVDKGKLPQHVVFILVYCCCWLPASAWSMIGREGKLTPATHNVRTYVMCRRSLLISSIMVGTFTHRVNALDMDSFANQQLAATSDRSRQPVTSDEALCRYGSPSPSTGAACQRAGLSPQRSGTLDAFGNVDRGSYVRCKQFYDKSNGAYEKKTVCE